MSSPKSHHGAAPAVYLAPFSKHDKKAKSIRSNSICILSKDREPRINAIKDVNVVNHQFSLNFFDDQIGKSYVETEWSKRFEGPYGEIRDKIIEGEWPLSHLDRNILGNFIAMSFVKDHRRLDLLRSLSEKTAKESISKDSYLTESQIETIAKIVDSPSRDIGLLHLLERVKHYAKILVLRHQLTLFKSKTPLFTSNSPIAICRLDDKGKSFTSLDFGIKKFEAAFFPISRDKGLFFRSLDLRGNFIGDYPLNSSGMFDNFIENNEDLSTCLRNSVKTISSEIYVHPDDVEQLRKMNVLDGFILPN